MITRVVCLNGLQLQKKQWQEPSPRDDGKEEQEEGSDTNWINQEPGGSSFGVLIPTLFIDNFHLLFYGIIIFIQDN